MKSEFSLLILAGALYSGRSENARESRAETINAALDRLCTNWPHYFHETLMVADDPLQYLNYDVGIMSGIYSPPNPLTGMQAGLSVINTPYCLIIADDALLSAPEIPCWLLDQASDAYEAVIPKHRSDSDPLLGVFAKTCLNRLDNHIRRQEYSLNFFLHKLKVKRIVTPCLGEPIIINHKRRNYDACSPASTDQTTPELS